MKFSGIVMIAGGILAVVFPFRAGIALEVFFGAILATAGVVHLVDSLRRHGADHRRQHYALSAIYLAGGALLLLAPVVGVAAASILIALTFISQGAAQLFLGFRSPARPGRGWMMISGVLGLLVGVTLIAEWPTGSLWVVGFLTGMNLIILGIAILSIRHDLKTINP